MDVRLARPTDAPLVLALVLDEKAHLVKTSEWPGAGSAIPSLVRAAVPLAVAGRSWIARDGANVALLEARPRRYVIGWEVCRLVVRGDPELVLAGAVGAVTAEVQSRGIPRLFARCCRPAGDELKAVGFEALAREYILSGPKERVTADDSLPVESRYRMPQDAWPLHQLESETTPGSVRQLEGVTSVQWSEPARDMSEIVVERDGKVVAWIGWGGHAGRGLTRIGMLLHPNHKDLGPELLQHALGRLSPGHRYLAKVREYQEGTFQVFLDAGFEVVAEEVLMVKHATVEYARTAKARMRVARVPGIQAYPYNFRVIAIRSDRAPVPIPNHQEVET